MHREFRIGSSVDEEIVEPTLTAAEGDLEDFICDTEPEGFAGAIVKLRQIVEGDWLTYGAGSLGQVLAYIKHQLAKGAAPLT